MADRETPMSVLRQRAVQDPGWTAQRIHELEAALKQRDETLRQIERIVCDVHRTPLWRLNEIQAVLKDAG